MATTSSSRSYDAIANAKLKFIKDVALSPNLTTIPTNYVFFADPNESSAVDPELFHDHHIPIIDFSLLASASPHQRSKVVQDLANACQHWGFFMVVNHGVSESLMKAMIEQCNQFFNLTVEEKQEFEGKHVLDPIRCGTSFNYSAEKVNFWRDYLKVMVHPQFHSPTKPHDFSEISSEYCKQIRHVVRVLLRGISASLGLDEMEIERSMNLERSQQILIANLYPPCPQPNLAIGMPAHSDHGLLTLLTQNDVGGLQILHEGEWVSANPLPNAFLVNTGDHIEILSNGKYKSVVHRVAVNSRATRISLAIANGPSLDTVVSPAPQLLNNGEHGGANYKPMMYKDFVLLQQSNQLAGSQIPQQSTSSYAANSKLKFIKELAESPNLTTIPSNYAYFADHHNASSAVDQESHEYHIPIIDLSFLSSGSPDRRSKIVQDLAQACQHWGFFMVVNHGVPESLMKAMIDKCDEFFNLTVEEKQEFEGKHVLDPIRCGTSFNISAEDVNSWRDYLKVMVHTHFHSPTKPHDFSEISSEYCKQVRRVTRVLLRGISTSLGLDEMEIERSMNLEKGQQILAANLYPPCPQPNLAIGLPPHSDHGLLTLLIQNHLGGLQILHDGKWVPVDPLPNSFLVNIGDHLEIFSNGKYKSVMHRAIVNNRATRISIAMANGPSLDTVVSPAPQLVNCEENVAATYKPMVYREYMELQQSNRLVAKSCLDSVRV